MKDDTPIRRHLISGTNEN